MGCLDVKHFIVGFFCIETGVIYYTNVKCRHINTDAQI